MATARTTEDYEGVVIRQVTLKENDVMIDAIGPKGLFSFFARGVMKIDSKNSASCQLLAHSKFSLAVGPSGGLSLSESEAIKNYGFGETLERLAVLNFIAELSAKVVQKDESIAVWPWLIGTLQAIDGKASALTAGLVYFAHVLAIGGYGLNVDSCVLCGKKSSIIAISFRDGGFVCSDCFDPLTMVKSNAREMKVVRYLFKCAPNDIPRIAFEKDEMKKTFDDLSVYLNDLTGVTLRSKALIDKV